MKHISFALVTLAFLFSVEPAAANTYFGEYKVKINATNAEKWKVKWLCNNANGSTSTIDSDTYPSSSSTTRSTNITSSKCSTGDWKVEFYIKVAGDWRSVKPGANVCRGGNCGFWASGTASPQQYARPQNHFNSSKKLCLKGYNFSYNSIYVAQVGC